LTLQQDLRQALVDGGFEIHYQPVVDLRSDEVTGCEALLRWRHPERGMISPAEFIPVAEDTGLIVELGEWVLRTACNEAATWPAHVRLAVNVSPVQLKSPTLAMKVAAALAASGLPANRLELEITEAVLIRDDATALAILHQLRGIGVRIGLDDFGTGYSSLSYLKRFPFDKIKIDRCFISDVAEIDGSSAIVQAIVNIAASRTMSTQKALKPKSRENGCARSAVPKCRAICSAPPNPVTRCGDTSIVVSSPPRWPDEPEKSVDALDRPGSGSPAGMTDDLLLRRCRTPANRLNQPLKHP
jgi:EAL domain-containing protein (putative c-di-GMP-specific phosphodiesterase class I)